MATRYDLGVTGGVTSFQDFQQKFFPAVYAHQQKAPGETRSEAAAYCTYDNQALQLFTSSLFLAGIFSALLGSATTRSDGTSLIPQISAWKCCCTWLTIKVQMFDVRLLALC